MRSLKMERREAGLNFVQGQEARASEEFDQERLEASVGLWERKVPR